MLPTAINDQNTEFVLLSFEGPDPYSLAGGLGVRVSNLAATLAEMGHATHLLFVGDAHLPGVEMRNRDKLVLHRWCQWISEYYPKGVYQGENEKLRDFNESVPHFTIEHIVKPALKQGKLVALLGEEWHTAEAMSRISDQLQRSGLRDRVVMFWNANNTMSFHRVDWKRLARTTTLTTVSRYMKHIMWGMGLNPLVIPNGIPRCLLGRLGTKLSDRLKRHLDADLILTKVARWDPDKRWNMAVESVARLKSRGMRTVLLARGGIEPHGEEVLYHARSLGLTIKEVTVAAASAIDYMKAIQKGRGADILNLKFHCPQEFLRLVYNASNAVLANSGHEPFGLVGLETMAAGGIAFTGSTGEDYAIPFHNAIVLETSDPKEIEAYVMYLQMAPGEERRIRLAARQAAKRYVWEEVVKNLTRKLEYEARLQGALAIPRRVPIPPPREAERWAEYPTEALVPLPVICT
jgi:glycosyltransferase involved in cell wall biosynthesis